MGPGGDDVDDGMVSRVGVGHVWVDVDLGSSCVSSFLVLYNSIFLTLDLMSLLSSRVCFGILLLMVGVVFSELVLSYSSSDSF